MKAGVALLALLALAGCAMAPSRAVLKPAVTTTGEEGTMLTRARVHTELAAGYFELGSMGVALEEVREALRADANYGPAYNVAGLVYAELKEERLAQENFQRALRINPLDSDANNNYGRYLCERKREAEGIKYFLAALSNPLYAKPDLSFVNAGVCSRRRGDIASAETYFLNALKVRPDQPQALYNLADIAYARGNYAQAKDYLTGVMQVVQPTAETLWLALRIERRLGDQNAEASYGMQLRRQFPNSKEANAMLVGRDP